MKVIALGDIADKFIMDDLPERGVVIEATKEELQNLPPVLYRDVEVVEKKPPRNCDKFRDTDEAYNQFMRYVQRENPAHIRRSPLHTVWDALKWVLDFADGDSGVKHENEAAVRLKYSPTTQEDCRWVVCSYGHLLPPWCGDDDAPVRKFTGAEFAQMIRDNYDLTYARNALAAHYAEDGIGEVWNRHLGDAIGDGFNWTLNSWVEGLSFSRLEGCAGKKRKEGV